MAGALSVRRDHGGPRPTKINTRRCGDSRCAGAEGQQDAVRHARDLNKDAVPTAQGACEWSQATVRALVMRDPIGAL